MTGDDLKLIALRNAEHLDDPAMHYRADLGEICVRTVSFDNINANERHVFPLLSQ